jgi:AraC-like DNA-binding protein
MRSVKFTLLPPPELLKNDVECIRVAESSGEEALAIHVAPTGVPGIVFHQNNGRPALDEIATASGRSVRPPILFLYGPGTDASVMRYSGGSFTTTQVIFRPHALKTLMGMNASALANGSAALGDVVPTNLLSQLLEAPSERERVRLLTAFLVERFRRANARDTLVEESLRLIHQDIATVRVGDLLDRANLSERQFERRFIQTVGLSPHVYIRLRRFNEAIRLIKTGRFERLTDVAHALNFYDQSHLIRDIKAFSGTTPRLLSHRAGDFHHDQAGYSFLS